MKNYILKIAVLTLLLAVAGWLVFSLVIPEYYLPVFPFVLLFYVSFSIAIHTWQLQLAKSSMGRFTRSNLILTFLKLLIYSTFAIIYIAVNTENAKIFIVVFMFLYLVFNIFEVILLTAGNSEKK